MKNKSITNFHREEEQDRLHEVNETGSSIKPCDEQDGRHEGGKTCLSLTCGGFLGALAVGMVTLQLILVLFSWIITAVEPSLPFRSLLSAEGVRWLFGGFVTFVGSQLLVWLLVCSMAWGTFVCGGLRDAVVAVFRRKPLSYRSGSALIAASLLFLAMLVFLSLLAFLPHALLLGVTGCLFPGTFASGIVPALAFTVLLPSLLYGALDGRLTSLSAAYSSLTFGVFKAVPLLPVYIFATVLYHSVLFVFF